MKEVEMTTKTIQLTSKQMQAIWDGAGRSGTFEGEPHWKQLEIERKLMKETEKIRTRLFWIFVDVEEIKNRLLRK